MVFGDLKQKYASWDDGGRKKMGSMLAFDRYIYVIYTKFIFMKYIGGGWPFWLQKVAMDWFVPEWC